MGLWPWTKRKKVEAVGQLMLVRARFDAAQTTPDNHKHWSNADYVSADAAASPEVRRTLRNRALYEVANNTCARGIVLTLANDVIGTCLRLQMLADSAEANGTVGPEFVAPGEGTRTGYPFSPLPLPHGQEQGFRRLQ